MGKGDSVDNDRNPWCARQWAGGSAFPPDYLRFATADSPTGGKDGYQIEVDRYGGTMYPLLWCELTTRWRILPRSQRFQVRHCGDIPNMNEPCRLQKKQEEEAALEASEAAEVAAEIAGEAGG